jgi:NAD(P)-dependent dehydrogenase (short-subunit alcohol dehydrogenase family)
MVGPDMIEKGSGAIMVTSSTGAFHASEVLGTYGISKLADIALVRNLAAEWGHAYDRQVAAYPVQDLYLNKFWAPVSRIDNVFGDRNLVCSCPPPEAWVTDPEG